MSKSKKALEKFVRDDPVNALKDVEEILGREMRPTAGDDNGASNKLILKHYLVKWKGLSYIHCTWVPEKEFTKAYKKLPHLRTKVNNFDERMLYYDNSEFEHVPIRPEYTTVDRILACRQHEEGKEYLVKWEFLDYDECHWESESDISSFQEQIQIFNKLQSRYHNRGVTDSKKKLEEFQQFEESPAFLCGGTLSPYQLEGLNFLRSSWSKQTHVILEDETGSGKMMQSIAFQASLCEENVFPHLMVAPQTSLLGWKHLFTRYAPHMNLVMSKSKKALEKFVRDDPVNALKDVEEILGREMRPTAGDDNGASNKLILKHYLVKWKGLSYIHCTWVPEKEFTKAYKKLPHLRTKVNNFDERMLYYDNSEIEHVPIRPEYTTVDRILACRQHEEGKEYLVKWEFLDYDECHWESESDISSFQEQIQIFNKLQSRYHNRGVTDSKKKLEEFQQFEESPAFLCGGTLSPYQLEGLNFLRSSWSKQTHVILEDETGSGKMMQSIAFQASLCEENVFPHLMVAPQTSLLGWKHLFTRYAPHMNLVMSKSKKALEKFVRDDPVNALKDVEEILGREMRPTAGDDNGASNKLILKHYLVKWKGLSYIHCTWVPEKEFTKAYKKLPHLRTKVNNFDERMLYYDNSEIEHVPIRPEYTTVDRILACRQREEGKEYLVKWEFLDYDECHWESESDISSFQEQIQIFNKLQSRYHNRGVTDSKKKLEEFQQFEESPAFLCGGTLSPYQLEGLNFLRSSWSKQTHVILEDETGSGKMMQSIAFQASLCEENVFPHLMVAPQTSLLGWKHLFTRYAPHMNLVMYDGEDTARAVIQTYEFYFPESHKNKKLSCAISESKQERIKFDVLLTSYEMIEIDYRLLKSIHWETMIVDEGRRLESKDLTFLLLKQFDTRHRTLLAGAPLQNNLDELFMPLHFVDAGKFANLEEFQKEFRNMNQEEQISRLDKMLAPHLFRRSALTQTHVFRHAGTSISRRKSAESVEIQTPVDVGEPNNAERKRKANAMEATSSNPGAGAAIHRHSLQPDTPPPKKTKVSEGGVVVPETMLLPRESLLSKEKINEILPEVERLLLPNSKNCVKGSTNEGLGMELVSDLLHGLQTALVVRQHFQDHAIAIAARKTAEVKLSEALEQLKKADGVEAKLAASERELVKTQAELKKVQEEKMGALEERVSWIARHAKEKVKLLEALEQLKKVGVEAKAAACELILTQVELKRVREEKKVAVEEMVSLKARHAKEEVKLSEALEQLKKANEVEVKLAASERKLVKTHSKLKRVRKERKTALEEMVSLKAQHAKEVKLSETLAHPKKADGVEAKLAASERELVKTQVELKTVREEKKVAVDEMVSMKARHAEEVMSSHVIIEGLDRKVEKLTKELEESEKKVRTLGEEDEVEAYVVMRTCTELMKQVLDGRSTNWKRREVVDRFVAMMRDRDLETAGDAGCSGV